MNDPVLVLSMDGEMYVFGDLDEMTVWMSMSRTATPYRFPSGMFFPMARDDAEYLWPSAFGD
jgi:hypothetical protein